MKIFFIFIFIPIIIWIEVIYILTLFPVCEDSFWKSILFYLGIYTAHELYRFIINYYEQ